MHVFHYNGEGLSPNSEGDEWAGKVRMIVDKLDAMKLGQKNMKVEQKELGAKMEELNGKVDQILETLNNQK